LGSRVTVESKTKGRVAAAAHLRDLIICLYRIYHGPHDRFDFCVLHVLGVPHSPKLVIDVKSSDCAGRKTALEILYTGKKWVTPL
jgi:hypothetical protein